MGFRSEKRKFFTNKKTTTKSKKGSFFYGNSTSDPTKGVRGFLFTFNDCNTINANREMNSWVSETVDLLYPEWDPTTSDLHTQKQLHQQQDKEQEQDKEQVENVTVIAAQEPAATDNKVSKKDDDECNNNFPTKLTPSKQNTPIEKESTTSDSDSEDGGISLFSATVKRARPTDKIRTITLPTDNTDTVPTTITPEDQQQSKKQKSNISDLIKDEMLDVTLRVFQLDVGLRGVGFTQITDPQVDIGKVHEHMLRTQMMEEKLVKSRYVIRLLPIYSSCFSSIEALQRLSLNIIPAYFDALSDGLSFCTILERRTKNETMDRDIVMRTCASTLPQDKNLTVEYKNPDVCIIVQVVGRATFLGFCRNYMELKKCNVQSLAESAMTEVNATKKIEKEEAQKKIEQDYHEELSKGASSSN